MWINQAIMSFHKNLRQYSGRDFKCLRLIWNKRGRFEHFMSNLDQYHIRQHHGRAILKAYQAVEMMVQILDSNKRVLFQKLILKFCVNRAYRTILPCGSVDIILD